MEMKADDCPRDISEFCLSLGERLEMPVVNRTQELGDRLWGALRLKGGRKAMQVVGLLLGGGDGHRSGSLRLCYEHSTRRYKRVKQIYSVISE
jgi:hypothetical protein